MTKIIRSQSIEADALTGYRKSARPAKIADGLLPLWQKIGKERQKSRLGWLEFGKQWDGLLLTLTYRRLCATMVSANPPFRE